MMNAVGISIVVGIGFVLVSLLIDRVWIPFHARRRVARLLKSKGKDPRILEKPAHGSVLGDAAYLRITNPKGETWEVRWSEVEEVHAFKRDLFTTDLICLAFKKSGQEEYYEIHEEMVGYHDLLEVLPHRLPNFTTDWFRAVAFPAFKTNHQVAWKRTSAKPRCRP